MTPAPATAPKPKVKALVWKTCRDGSATAESIFGTWSVWDFGGKDGHYMPPGRACGLRIGDDVEAAKAAAQADYEARILSALDLGDDAP